MKKYQYYVLQGKLKKITNSGDLYLEAKFTNLAEAKKHFNYIKRYDLKGWNIKDNEYLETQIIKWFYDTKDKDAEFEENLLDNIIVAASIDRNGKAYRG